MSEQPTAPVTPEWELPDRLRRALRHAGVGSNEMAEYLEVSRHTISNWINGHTRPPATAMKLWAMKCGVDYRWLSQGIERRRPVPDDFGPPLLTDADIPSGITEDLDRPVTKEEILAYRKRVPIRRLADPLVILLARAAS